MIDLLTEKEVREAPEKMHLVHRVQPDERFRVNADERGLLANSSKDRKFISPEEHKEDCESQYKEAWGDRLIEGAKKEKRAKKREIIKRKDRWKKKNRSPQKLTKSEIQHQNNQWEKRQALQRPVTEEEKSEEFECYCENQRQEKQSLNGPWRKNEQARIEKRAEKEFKKKRFVTKDVTPKLFGPLVITPLELTISRKFLVTREDIQRRHA
ncbi:MAG: hypothetical protein V3R57_09890, partial [Candidatus Bathyarchaeia archaeon]